MLSMQTKKVNRNEPLSALVLFPGSLGDLLCLLPALEAISHSTGDGKVEVVARGVVLELLQRLSFIRCALSLDRGVFAQLFSPDASHCEEISVLFSSIAEIFSWFGHAQGEIRANLARLAPGRVRSFAFFTGQEDCHVTAYYLRCVGVEELRCPSFLLGEKERQWLDHYWQRRNWRPSSRVLVLHPGSGGKRKRWEPEGFMRVCHWWRQHRRGKVLILLGPAEEEEKEQWRQMGEVENSLSLLQVAALLSRADVYLGNDSGVSHLAGAVGARGVVLFGPTHPYQWKPLGGSLLVIYNSHYREAMPDILGILLTEISSEEVIAALARF
jgi:ADP-heptose:LPS heptosyltransferase